MAEIYLRARLNGVRFALPAPAVLKILSDPVVIPVPDAPEGICGLVYNEGKVLPIRSFSPGNLRPSQLVILCRFQAGYRAYAADCVEAMEPLQGAEQDAALADGDAGILLLDKEATA